MQDSGSSPGRAVRKLVDEISKGAFWVLPAQMFPSNTTNFISNMCLDPSVFGKERQTPLKQRSLMG